MANKKVTHWHKAFATDQDRPYDLSLFRRLVHKFYGDENVKHCKKTNFIDEISDPENKLIIISAEILNLDEYEQGLILDYIKRGDYVLFVVGNPFVESVDTFGYKADNNFYPEDDQFRNVVIKQRLPQIDSFSFETLPFTAATTLIDEEKMKEKAGYSTREIWSTIDGQPAISISYFNNGGFIMNHIPETFTNHFLVNDRNEQYVWNLLNHLPEEIDKVIWLDYKKRIRTTMGSKDVKPKNSLTTLMQFPMWRIAIILSLIGFGLFLLFRTKRREFIIPKLKKKKNTYLDFVDTVSFLYFNRANHQNLSVKMVNHFYDMLRTEYQSPPTHIDEAYLQKIAIKSRLPYEEVVEDFKVIQDFAKNKLDYIQAQDLLKLNNIIKKYRK